MKVELKDNVLAMSLKEVVDALVNGGSIQLDDGEFVSESFIDGGSLLVFTEIGDPHDGRASYSRKDYAFSIYDLRDLFDNGDYVAWAKSESGADVLLCFGFC